MTPKITIAYVTGRREPHFDWFADSLCNQTTPEQRANLQVVFVDGCLWHEEFVFGCQKNAWTSLEINFSMAGFHDADRRRELIRIVAGRFDFLHVPPLPTAWQGPFRQTTKDFFCASNTRNTAFVVAQHPYLAFCDDLAVLMPGWFNQVLHAAQGEYVVCGAYKKVKQLRVVNGAVESYEPFSDGVDSRWGMGSDAGVVHCAGGSLYGCSFGIPLAAALEVDGFDGTGNGGGFEDCDFGLRLDRAGWPFFYNRNMLTLESEEDHHIGEAATKYRKVVTPENLPKAYDSYRVPNEAEKYWSDHVILNRLCNETDRIFPLIGYGLTEMRAKFMATGLVPLPKPNELDWRDGALLKDL